MAAAAACVLLATCAGETTGGTGGTGGAGGRAGSGGMSGFGGSAGSAGTGGVTGTGGTGGSAGSAGTGGVTGAGGSAGSAGSGGSGGSGGASCYSEIVHLDTSINDLAQMYASSRWLPTSLDVLSRRYPDGHTLLDMQQADPDLPRFADPSSFAALMESLMTMCHEETHGWDFDHSTSGEHAYYMRADLAIRAPELETFPRSEILMYITDNVTQSYDDTYLRGQQGTYDLIFLGDELTAYTNGLACIASVGDQVTSGISGQDGASAHLYYLELYLKRARTAHPSVYMALKNDPDWQRFVRVEWARVHFWRQLSQQFPNLDIGEEAIWAKVLASDNQAEIQLFTGQDPATVACTP